MRPEPDLWASRAAGLGRVALGREEPWADARLARGPGSPPVLGVGPPRWVGLATAFGDDPGSPPRRRPRTVKVGPMTGIVAESRVTRARAQTPAVRADRIGSEW